MRDWMRKMSYFIEFVREAPDLATLERMTLPVPKGEKWPAAHTNSFTQSQRYSGIVLDGKNVFIDSEVDLRGLQIISALREKVATIEELESFLKEVAGHGFFHVSTRIKANQIVRAEINAHLGKVTNTAELELLRASIENSGILRRLTPQGRTGLRRALDNAALKLAEV